MHSDNEDGGIVLDHVDNFPDKKKKKKRGGRKKRAATGFEEYYADAPTTPAEALREQQELYASSVPFEQRIQTCIHRYRTRRHLDTELSTYFHEYMFIGGIDMTTSSFNENDLEDGSLIPRPDSDATAAEADDEDAAAARFYNGNARHWTVDFAGVAAGFLSVSMPPLTGVDWTLTERAIGFVENFLRYVLQHDVCPEHAGGVNEALAVCARARDEWPRLWRFKGLLPGRFNLAAAQTFGVHEPADWSLENQKPAETALSPEVVFYASMVAAGQQVPKTAAGRSGLHLVRQFTCELALQRVEMPDDDVTGYFGRLALGADSHTPLHLQPLGRAVFRPTVIEDGWVRQVPQEQLPDDEDIVFLWERELLAAMTVGMKMTAHVGELSSGFRFVKALETVQPSFYTFLPQHLIKDYKPPRVNDRPPPSIHDGAQAGKIEDEEMGQVEALDEKTEETME